MEHSWMEKGSCRAVSPELFFPSDGAGVEQAKRICATCSVQSDCLTYALTYRIDHGVWGGTSERQRRRMLRSKKHNMQLLRSSEVAAKETAPDYQNTI